MLLSKHPDAVLSFLFSETRWDQKLLTHLYSQSARDFLIRVVLAETASYLDDRRELVVALLGKLEEETARPAAACLSELAAVGPSSVYWKDLTQVLFSADSFSRLFSLLSSDHPQAPISAGRVLVSLCNSQFFRVAICRPSSKSQEDETVTVAEDDESGVSDFLAAVLSGCGAVTKTIEKESSESAQVAENQGFEPVGELKLVCVELVLALTKVDIQMIILQLGRVGVFSMITNLFFKYHWNSILHGYFYQICTIILNSPVLDVRSTLTLETSLVEQITKFQTNVSLPSGQVLRKGQRGFITRISSMLIKVSESHGDVEEVLSRAEGWADYVKDQLLPTLAIENKVGPDSRVQTQRTEEDEDPEMEFENAADKQFETFMKGENRGMEQQIGAEFEEAIPVGEDLNIDDLDQDAALFDFSDKQSQFESAFKNPESAASMRLTSDQAAEAIARSSDYSEEKDFNTREFWRLPIPLDDLEDLA